MVHFFLNLRRRENADEWETKNFVMMYVDLGADSIKLAVYVIFFLVILKYYGLPLHLIRQVLSPDFDLPKQTLMNLLVDVRDVSLIQNTA
jgi:hypothetical protein